MSNVYIFFHLINLATVMIPFTLSFHLPHVQHASSSPIFIPAIYNLHTFFFLFHNCITCTYLIYLHVFSMLSPHAT